MNPAKIRLSAKEMELVTNADFILTKNSIMHKAKQLLEELQNEQQMVLQSFIKSLPAEILKPSPKISRGENYKGLPYLVLDHPRYFDKENSCAIRTMFWWGNFFSVTLHLSGRYKENAESNITEAYTSLLKKYFFISVSDKEWEHHFEIENYRPVSQLNKQEFTAHITQHSFLKLAQKIPLQQWDEAKQTLSVYFQDCLELLAD